MSNGTITMTGAEYDALAGKIAALESELARLRAGQEPVRFWFIGDAGQQKGARYCKKSSRDGSLAFFECEEDAKRAALRHPGTEVYPVEYYRKPQATPQPSAVPDIAGWLWHWLMDYCKKNSQPPATRNDLFAVVSDLHKMLAAAPSAPTTVQSDADNYRWLRDQHNNVNSDIGVYDGANILATSDGELDLDAAIAAARQEGGE